MLCPAFIPVGDCYTTLLIRDELKVFQFQKVFLQLGKKHLGKISRTKRQILEKKVWQLCTPPSHPKKGKRQRGTRKKKACNEVLSAWDEILLTLMEHQHSNQNPLGLFSWEQSCFQRAIVSIREYCALAMKSSCVLCILLFVSESALSHVCHLAGFRPRALLSD